ncbi:MAG: response regulator [Verrucomicrobiae bacterium]|nr:response regulator [Verrucomicrobiae bacterium]
MSKILIVDDEAGILDVLQCWFSEQGHQITTTTKGDEAIRLLPQIDPDLVITDIRMSPVDGVQVLLAAKKYNPIMAVIMMTGHLTTTSDAAEAKKLGADDYICKPFQLEDFGRRVEIALKLREQLRT